MSSILTRITLGIIPGAARNEVIGLRDGTLRIKITAPPREGKANRELLAYLSQLLGVSQGTLNILSGHTSRNKVISVTGLNREEVMRRLMPGPSSSGAASK